jgi:putative hydrolase of the HAD superfamily
MIFFDIDGTLVDHKGAERTAALAFQKDHAEIFPESSDRFVIRWQTVEEKHIRRYLKGGLSFQGQRRARIRELFNGYGPFTDAEADEIFTGYLKRYEQNWRLFEDVKPSLDNLSRHALGIISNGDPKQQRDKLQALGIAGYFSHVLISGDIGIAKPDPGIFQAACRAAGKQPQECMYVGDDYEVDIVGSRRAGLTGVWLNRNGLIHPEENNMIKTLRELRVVPDSVR